MDEAEREKLRAAVEVLHSCSAAFVSSTIVALGKTPVVREVATFDLLGHSSVLRCYAWTDLAGASVNHRVVLHAGAVRSAEDAVRGFLLSVDTTATQDADRPVIGTPGRRHR